MSQQSAGGHPVLAAGARALVASCVAVMASLLGSCRSEGDFSQAPEEGAPRPGIVRCERGLERALLLPTFEEASRSFYDECADVNREGVCRDAWRAAAESPVADRLGVVARACRIAYCPRFGSYRFEICRSDFVPSPSELSRAWPPLYEAILAGEADQYAAEISQKTLALAGYLGWLSRAGGVGSGAVRSPR